MNRTLRWGSIVTLAALLPLAAHADTVKLAGATTVVNVVVNPYRAAVEKPKVKQVIDGFRAAQK